MHSPIPGPFQGSMPSPDVAGVQHARLLDVSFSALALVAAAGVWVGADLAGPQADFVAVAKVSCAVLLVAAMTGMWMIERSADIPRLGVTVFLERLRHRRQAAVVRRAVSLSPSQVPAAGLAGLLEWFRAWLDHRPDDPSLPAAPDIGSSDRRSEAQRLVAALYREADKLSDTSNDIEESGRRLAGDLVASGEGCDLTQSALSRMTDRVVALTGAVTRTTSEADRITSASVALSELAFASQRKVASLDDRAASLQSELSQVEGLFGRVGALTEAAYESASRLGGSGASVAALAHELRDLIAFALTAISGIEASLSEMAGQAEAANATALEIAERIHLHHELGLGLSHAVTQQGVEIADILTMLDEAQAGFLTLRAGVEAVTRHGLARSLQTAKLREAASLLPTHADQIAGVLRGIPDFAPPIEFEF